MKIRKNRQSGFIEAVAMLLGLVMSVGLLSLNSARAKSRDAKRLADIRMLASANELYFNDKISYPEQLEQLTPMYIGVIPKPPEPQDGVCSSEQNKYNYFRLTPENYQLTFCLGQSTGGYLAGVHTLTQKGIE